ncbi:SGNH/GDSL hydrolase family protein [Microbacterium sp.]|uniref:SGNH/GDSL hydrolase family protein n=1 Tax=Microbacterium sp. TaxID=51671 RepID=UPI0039E2A766
MSAILIDSFTSEVVGDRVIVCAGDSITRGQVSSPWVDTLAERYAPSGAVVVNAGVNGNLAWNVLQRLDAVIAARPAVVTVLVGTNDVCATNSPEMEALYREQQGIPETPTPEWFEENIAGILDRLRTETDARIAVIELPPVGERLDSEINAKVRAYNARIHSAAMARDVTVLPLYDLLVAELPEQHEPGDYTGDVRLTIQAAQAHASGLSWDEISERNGLSLLIDHVHLNDRAGAVLAALVERFLGNEIGA